MGHLSHDYFREMSAARQRVDEALPAELGSLNIKGLDGSTFQLQVGWCFMGRQPSLPNVIAPMIMAPTRGL